MPLKYGDVVVKVQKLRDGSFSRVNAIVLATLTHKQVKGDRSLHDEAEHLDLAFADPGLVPEGQVLKTRNIDSIFRLAYDVAPFVEGNAIGYEPAIHGEPIKAFLHLITNRAVQEFADSDEGCQQLTAIMEEYHAKLDAIPVEGTVGEGVNASQLDPALEQAFMDAQLAEQAKRDEAGKPSSEDLDAVAAEQAAAAATEGHEVSSSTEQ